MTIPPFESGRQTAVSAPPTAASSAPQTGRPTGDPRTYYRFCKLLVQLSFIYLVRGRAFGVRHVPRTGGVLLLANHQSYFDPPLAGLALPRECNFMARDTLFRHPAFAWLIRRFNAFPVKRGTADVTALKEGLRRLRDGRALLVFPEGTRSTDGVIGEFLLGPILLAKRAEVPIVPVVIHGAFECWPRNRKWPTFRPICVAYAPPISVEQVLSRSPEELAAEVRTTMVRKLEELRAHDEWARPRFALQPGALLTALESAPPNPLTQRLVAAANWMFGQAFFQALS